MKPSQHFKKRLEICPVWGNVLLALVVLAIPTPSEAQTTRIVEVDGEATVKKKNESQERRATPGTELFAGDWVKPQVGARVDVRCSDGRLSIATPGIPSGVKAICPSVTPRRDARAENIFLDLLFSRFAFATQVLDGQLLLKWEPIPGVTDYQVQMLQEDNTIWQTNVNGTEVRYEGTALEPGIDYLLRVTPANAQDNQSIYELGLIQLDGDAAGTVQTKIAEIEAEEVGEEAKAFMLVDLYREVGLSDEAEDKPGLLLVAIASLELLVEQGNQTPAVHRLLGEFYLLTGQLQRAENRYREAVQLAEESENIAEQTEAEVGLAHVYVATGKLAESRQMLKAVLKKYEVLGNQERMTVIEQWLERVKRQENQAKLLWP